MRKSAMLIVVFVLLAGCSGRGGDSVAPEGARTSPSPGPQETSAQPSPTPTGDAVAREAVTDAYARSRDMGSHTFESESVLSFLAGEEAFNSVIKNTAKVDLRTRQASQTTVVNSEGLAVSLRARTLIDLPGKTWVSVDSPDVGELWPTPWLGCDPRGSASVDLLKLVAVFNELRPGPLLGDVSGPFDDRVGTVPASRYEMELDIEQAIDLIAQLTGEPSLTDESLRARGSSLSVWVGSEGLVLKDSTVVSLLFEDPLTGDDVTIDFTDTTEYSDYGEPVSVVPPSDEDVTWIGGCERMEGGVAESA